MLATVQVKKFYLITFQSKDTKLKYRRLFGVNPPSSHKAVNIEFTDKERKLTVLSTRCKGKCKVHSRTGHEVPEEGGVEVWFYSFFNLGAR